MRPLVRSLTPSLLAAALFGASAIAQTNMVEADTVEIDAIADEANSSGSPSAVLSAEQRGALEALIREYLLENPEVIEEAIFVLQDRREAERRERERAAIAALNDQLFEDSRDFSVGPEDAPIQIVEFFDYNCSYCRRSTDWVRETLAAYPDQVRFVFKETPIFSDSSESSGVGARAAAVTARLQPEKYLDLHFALMGSSGTIPTSQVRQIAEDVGVNWRRVSGEMDDPAVADQVEASVDLLYDVGANGTPAFVVNGELVQGANFVALDTLIADALLVGE